MQSSPMVFPQPKDRPRLEKYKQNDLIFEGEHYDAFSIVGEKDFTERYKRLRYIVANFAGLISKISASTLFGEKITIDVEDDKTQKFLDGLMEHNSLHTQLYESALANSRRGDAVFKLRTGKRNPLDLKAKTEIIIEEINAGMYFPTFDPAAARNVATQDVIVSIIEQGQDTYLHKEIHQPGFIFNEVYLYNPKEQKIISTEDPARFGFLPRQETKVSRSLVFHIPNFRSKGYFGTSDYKDIANIFFAINNRMTKIDGILDKHADPILAVPPGVLDEEGKVRKEALGMFEVNNDNPGFTKPEYIVWDANLDASFKQLDKLIEVMLMIAEIAPAALGMDKNGQAESGRALRFKMLATLRKIKAKMQYYDQGIKDMVFVAQELSIAWNISVDDFKPAKAERPTIAWSEGIIKDLTEMIDNAIKRIDGGISSRADEIAKIDDVTPDEAKKRVKEIDEEKGPELAPLGGNDPNNPTNVPDSTGKVPQNAANGGQPAANGTGRTANAGA
jgi:hypothetical protein